MLYYCLSDTCTCVQPSFILYYVMQGRHTPSNTSLVRSYLISEYIFKLARGCAYVMLCMKYMFFDQVLSFTILFFVLDKQYKLVIYLYVWDLICWVLLLGNGIDLSSDVTVMANMWYVISRPLKESGFFVNYELPRRNHQKRPCTAWCYCCGDAGTRAPPARSVPPLAFVSVAHLFLNNLLRIHENILVLCSSRHAPKELN